MYAREGEADRWIGGILERFSQRLLLLLLNVKMLFYCDLVVFCLPIRKIRA
jgi:hypothetical protein